MSSSPKTDTRYYSTAVLKVLDDLQAAFLRHRLEPDVVNDIAELYITMDNATDRLLYRDAWRDLGIFSRPTLPRLNVLEDE